VSHPRLEYGLGPMEWELTVALRRIRFQGSPNWRSGLVGWLLLNDGQRARVNAWLYSRRFRYGCPMMNPAESIMTEWIAKDNYQFCHLFQNFDQTSKAKDADRQRCSKHHAHLGRQPRRENLRVSKPETLAGYPSMLDSFPNSVRHFRGFCSNVWLDAIHQ
jgi:hypothetical protein